MDVRVRDILNYSNFIEFEVLAGRDGLDRIIQTVSILDTPDGHLWLKGGEFIVSTGIMVKDQPDKFTDLIVDIANTGASAFAIKLGRYINELPKTVLNIADSLDFPIISIPFDISYADIIQTVSTDIINRKTRSLVFSEKVHTSFTQLVIHGGDTQKIVDVLSDLIQESVFFYDNFFNVTYCHSTSEEYSEDLHNLPINELLFKYRNYKIEVDGHVLGYILLSEINSSYTTEDYVNIAVEHASTVLILDIQKKISNYEIQTKYRDQLIQDLIFNNISTIEEAYSRAHIFKWSFENPTVAVIVEIDNIKEIYLKAQSYEFVDRKLREADHKVLSICTSVYGRLYKSVYTVLSDKVVLLIQITEKEMDFIANMRTLSEEVRCRVIQETEFNVTIGIGMSKSPIIKIHESYQEASKAIRLARKITKKDAGVFYSDLIIYRLLDSITDKKCCQDFYQQHLGRLIEYDEQYNSNLMQTLERLVENDWNMHSTAKTLYIHYNTMKYRVSRIGEILDIDLHAPVNKTNIDLAIKLGYVL